MISLLLPAALSGVHDTSVTPLPLDAIGAARDIPKTWEETALADWATPVAGLTSGHRRPDALRRARELRWRCRLRSISRAVAGNQEGSRPIVGWSAV